MRTSRTNETALVIAAQAGDRRAVDGLLTARLPLVYSIVRRALNGDPEADDVVQETMLRALRELPKLSNPESFRAWLAAIAVRQVSTHRHRGRIRVSRAASLDELTEAAAAEPGFEEVTVLQLELSGQRTQLVRASQWLDPDDRTLLSLWWLEAAGQLTRADLATALGVSVPHATVRIQRMRTQLEHSRALVAAIGASPGCAGLERVLKGWNGRTSSVWRKRIIRHTRSCASCQRAADGLIAPEGLLVGLSLLPVPVALAAGLLGKITLGASATGSSSAALTGGKAGLSGHLLHVVAAHPVTVMLVTGSVITGAVVVTANWPDSRSTPPVVIAVPSSAPATPLPTLTTSRPSATKPPTLAPHPSATHRPSALPLVTGPASLESANDTGFFVSTAQGFGFLTPAGPSSSREIRDQATFDVVAGLANPKCYSFRLSNGQYLRHRSWRLQPNPSDGSKLFKGDATFCPRTGSTPGSITLESSNYPGWFLRHRGNELWVDQANGTDQFRADSSFLVRAPLKSSGPT
jgi:RNA polymerase sigma factor (sigma-70 family)